MLYKIVPSLILILLSSIIIKHSIKFLCIYKGIHFLFICLYSILFLTFSHLGKSCYFYLNSYLRAPQYVLSSISLLCEEGILLYLLFIMTDQTL